jgi:vacuolar-type H+-ATPase subunit H
MNADGIDKIRKIRETEESVNRSIEDEKQKCKERTEAEKAKAEKEYKDLEASLQIKYELALKEKKAESDKLMQATVKEEKEKVAGINLNIDSKSAVDMLLGIMKDYVSE